MPVVIEEIVSEVVLSTPPEQRSPDAAAATLDDLEEVVRRATERVLEHLRREWDR